MTNPVYVSKNLIAQSTNGIATFSSGATSATVNSSSLGTARRIAINASSGSEAGASFTITGTNQGGQVITETITGPTSNVAVATTQDFLTVTSVISSSAINSQVIIGTNTQGGTPWQGVNLNISPCQISGTMTFSSTANSMAAQIDMTMDYPFQVPQAGYPTGGLPYPINTLPVVVVSNVFSSGTTGNTMGMLNITSSTYITPIPIAAWRMTLTSSSSGAGTVNFAAIQAGIGS
jgi:hypothetical protein